VKNSKIRRANRNRCRKKTQKAKALRKMRNNLNIKAENRIKVDRRF